MQRPTGLQRRWQSQPAVAFCGGGRPDEGLDVLGWQDFSMSFEKEYYAITNGSSGCCHKTV